MPCVRIDGRDLTTWESFHHAFATAFGFPDFYGKNMSAWIDCMTSLDSPEDGMTTVHGSESDPVVLHVANASLIPQELFEALTECTAFVNWRRMEVDESAILTLACWRTGPISS